MYLLVFSFRLKTIGLLAARASTSLAGATAFAALVLEVLEVLEVLDVLEVLEVLGALGTLEVLGTLELLGTLEVLAALLATCRGSVLASRVPSAPAAFFVRGFGGVRV